ncbi:hypothetical protein [Burkholderia ubonensis]|uniref:hypothetical protein n=1 Tax=Burkholderia ubonensis TaxID=101571 RepID=UPI000AD6E90A|nr:hypothetical protein [Burkholderia ubonensis]
MNAAAPRTLIYDLGRPFKAHDVRKLRKCVVCGAIGYEPQMLTLTLRGTMREHYHGTCVVRSMSHDEVLALPEAESAKLRLNETGPELMRKLMDRDEATGESA